MVLFSLILWSVFVIFWIMTVLITCAANISVTLIDHRGPESFWLTSNEYNRDISSEVNYEYYYYSSPGVDTVIDSRYIYYGDERDDDLEPLRKSHMFNYIFLKWLLIVLNFSVFACLVFGAWYVLICFYQEINNLRLCKGLTPQADAECRVTCCRLLQLKSINSYRE